MKTVTQRHYFTQGKDRSASLRAKISEMLSDVSMDFKNIGAKVNAFEKRLEEIMDRLDDLESRIKMLEELLED